MPIDLKVTSEQTLAAEVTEGHYLPSPPHATYGKRPVVLCESGAEQLNTKASIVRTRDDAIFSKESSIFLGAEDNHQRETRWSLLTCPRPVTCSDTAGRQ